MKHNAKRFLSLLLALVMVIGLMPMGHVHAEEADGSQVLIAARTPVTNLDDIENIEEGVQFVIATGRKDRAVKTMVGNAVSGSDKSGIELINDAPGAVDSETHANAFWTITKVEGGYTISADGATNVQIEGNNYAVLAADAVVQIRVSENGEYGSGYFEIYATINGTNYYLNYFDSFGGVTDSGCAASVWSGNDAGSQWRLYRVGSAAEMDPYGKRNWVKVEVDTETVYDAKEGLFEYAWDDNPGTHWHSNWQSATDLLTGENSFSGVIDFGQAYLINRFSFTPRVDQPSGQVTQASLYVKETEDAAWNLVAEHAAFAANGDKKDIDFPAQAVRYVKFVAEQSNDNWVAVSEFDLDYIAPGGEVEPEPTVKNAKILSDNTIVALGDCEYTLGGEENAYSLSHEGTYYVMPCANGSVIPQTIGEFSNLTLTWQDNGSVWIGSTLDGKNPGGGSIHIWTAGKDVPYWDRCGSGHGWNSSNGTHDLYLFRADENSTNAAIPGYTQVTAEDVQVGESYLIAAKQGDSTWYIMNPTASDEKFEHIALIVDEAVTHEHAFGEPSITEATCTTAGSVTYACDCGHIHTKVIPATGKHSYEAVVTAPTCTEGGYTTYTCSACGDSYVADETEALGHNDGPIVVENEKPSTCTEGGYYDAVCYCTVCGVETYRSHIEVGPDGHYPVVSSGHSATCTEPGLTDGTICAVCLEWIEPQEEIPALGHTTVTIPGYPATCEAPGLTDGSYCSVCGETFTVQEIIPALGHTPVVIPGYPADCENPGMTDGSYCSVCDATITAQEVIPALGHNYVDGVCTNCGKKAPKGVRFCNACGGNVAASVVKQYSYVCTGCGRKMKKTDRFCNVCGGAAVRREVGAAAPVAPAAPVARGPVCPTCGKPVSQGQRFCTGCGTTL